MNRVGKIVPPNKQILRDISLGLNGAGKSTLLRIMAGVDKDYIFCLQSGCQFSSG
ncbi:MAG: hypothetical protein ACOYYJ_18735 [Chloroflexota bacterium]